MLDLIYLRSKRQVLEEAMINRGYSLEILKKLEELDNLRRDLITQANNLRAKKNEISKRIAEKKRKGEDVSHLLEEAKRVDEHLKNVEEKERKTNDEFWKLWAYIPNIPHKSVQVGKDSSENVVVRQWGEIKKFDFEPKPHWEIGELLGILDFESASKMSGSGFAIYKGLGAVLERALINFFLDTHRKNGYVEVFPPILVKPEALIASGHLPMKKCIIRKGIICTLFQRRKHLWRTCTGTR